MNKPEIIKRDIYKDDGDKHYYVECMECNARIISDKLYKELMSIGIGSFYCPQCPAAYDVFCTPEEEIN